ncbi:unnamed protein product, partial [Dovyalis caffra]
DASAQAEIPMTQFCACSCDNTGTTWTCLSSKLTHTVDISQIAGSQSPIAANLLQKMVRGVIGD